MVMNIHYKCMILVYQYKVRRVPVTNPPAVTCMSALEKMIPVTQVCDNIWAISEIDLTTSRKNIPASTNLPAFIYIHTVMHTLVVVVNSPLH